MRIDPSKSFVFPAPGPSVRDDDDRELPHDALARRRTEGAVQNELTLKQSALQKHEGDLHALKVDAAPETE